MRMDSHIRITVDIETDDPEMFLEALKKAFAEVNAVVEKEAADRCHINLHL